ncbi:Hypothetical protein RG1141_PB01290 (plasmid) [Neorhizobium galegae bv. officinalis bv. officinalis str. HAMBI 1141]|uniref:Uncharacterized protein n=1 Tax=Neorhizobium galegae bv. officinalis bv. officinalis str. HAMBI 1141 TaxID=1028801 RepID=A0A068TJ68_NEOGA|nr:Hypothetical protein RG1141_PB01290 [Neorhizobium galegae bv. officinalis bv. officinalis str. HAMBI 1141]
MQFHAGKCPNCHNGRLFLFREIETGDVYGHCEECEQGYRSPDDIESNIGFLTLLDDSDAEWATEVEISRSVWANYRILDT